LQTRTIKRLCTVALLGVVVGCGSDAPPPPPPEPVAPTAHCWQNDTPVPLAPQGSCDPTQVSLEAVCKDEATWVFAIRNRTVYGIEVWLKVILTGELLEMGLIEPGTTTYSFDQPVQAPFQLALVLVNHKGETVEVAKQLSTATSTDVQCPPHQGRLVACDNPRLVGDTLQVFFRLSKGEVLSSVITVSDSAEGEPDSLERAQDGSFVGKELAFAPVLYSDLVYTPGAQVLQPIKVVGMECPTA
jgi:hypothetical protein